MGFWNQTSAVLALQSRQQNDGSFGGDIQSTTDVIVAMSALINGSGFLRMRRDRCKSLSYFQPYGSILDTWSGKTSNTTTAVSADATNSIDAKPKSGILTNTITKEKVSLPRTSNNQDSIKVSEGTTSKGPELTTVSFGDTTSPFHSDISATEGPDIVIKYWLWIGNDPLTAVKHNLTVHVPYNSTFFHMMLQAAQDSEAFE